MEPGLEPIRIPECRQVPPGAEESLLDRVSREFVVPEDESGRRVQPRDGSAGKHGEGVMIASPRSFDELSLVHDHPTCDGAASVSRSDGMSPWLGKGFPRGRATSAGGESRGAEALDRVGRGTDQREVGQDLADDGRELEPMA